MKGKSLDLLLSRLFFGRFDQNSGPTKTQVKIFSTQIFRDFQMKTLQERQKSPELALFSREIAVKLRSGAVKTQVKSLKTQVSRDALIW